MEKFALVVCLGLVGCAIEIPGEQPVMAHYPAEMRAAIEQWSLDYAAADPYELGYVIADEEQFVTLCGDKPGVTGCHWHTRGPEKHVLVLRGLLPESWNNTLTHEAMHWLAYCSGAFPDDQINHDAPEIWGKGGILDRTNKVLGFPAD